MIVLMFGLGKIAFHYKLITLFCPENDVYTRVGEHRFAHFSHFESESSILKRFLQYSNGAAYCVSDGQVA